MTFDSKRQLRTAYTAGSLSHNAKGGIGRGLLTRSLNNDEYNQWHQQACLLSLGRPDGVVE
jgi:hypothetical protein